MKSKSILVVVMVMVTTVLVCGTGAKATIVNPSFENSLTGWVTYNDPGMNRYPEDTFATDGQYNLQLFTEWGTSNTKGDKSEVYQNVSLTDIDQIFFDVKLSSHNYDEPSIFRDYVAMFIIDGITFWSQTVEGTYLNQFVDVSAQSGSHQIELRLQCINDENYSPSCWAEWDNLRTVTIPEPATPPDANANGPYNIYVGDTLTLDASGSTDADDDIASYVWDLDDDGSFETDAGGQAIFDVDYAHLDSLGFIAGGPYDIHVQVTDSQQQSDTDSSTLTIAPPPVIEAVVDIRPVSCPNPLNVKSKGVLPVAILGSAALDVTAIDAGSIFLNGARNIRSGYEDVAWFIADANDCECATLGGDGYLDLTLKFMTQDIVATFGEVNHDDVLELQLDGVLSDETPVEGADCVVIRGKHKPINKADINKDGVVNMLDVVMVAGNWLECSIVED